MRYKFILLVGVFWVATVEAQEAFPRKQVQQRRRPLAPQWDEPDEDGIHSSCPDIDGFFADATQCDKYYECIDGEMKEKLCPDGLVFDATRSDIEKCELQHLVDCSDRPQLQPAQPTPNCPRRNGYYAHNDTRICDKFFHCTDGRPHPIICPDGLIFSNKTATCAFRDIHAPTSCVFGEIKPERKTVEETEEKKEEDKVFRCPPQRAIEIEGIIQPAHPLYPDPKDCQYYYICIDGVTPRRSACEIGEVFSEKTNQCTSPKYVPECAGWYMDVLDYDENGELAHTTTTTTTTTPKPKPTRKPRPGVPVGPKRRGQPPGGR